MIETRPYDAAEYLDTDEAIGAYLAAAFEEGDPALIRIALGTVARAKGMTQLAREIGMTREGLYKALSEAGNPGFDVVTKLLRAFGLQLQVRPTRARQTASARRTRVPKQRKKAA
jgi:probable addiction module antidote protein